MKSRSGFKKYLSQLTCKRFLLFGTFFIIFDLEIRLLTMKKFLLFSFLLSVSAFAFGQSDIYGKWHTVDDETGKVRSTVEIYKRDNKAFGKVIGVAPGEDQDGICDECDEDDPRYNKKVIGMEIIKDLEKDDDEWDDGTILDPENGKVYRCKMWIEDGKLVVRGYIGFSLIGRSQTWIRSK